MPSGQGSRSGNLPKASCQNAAVSTGLPSGSGSRRSSNLLCDYKLSTTILCSRDSLLCACKAVSCSWTRLTQKELVGFEIPAWHLAHRSLHKPGISPVHAYSTGLLHYLDARIDLKEIVPPRRLYHELHCAGIAVINMPSKLDSIVMQLLADAAIQGDCWSHLYHLCAPECLRQHSQMAQTTSIPYQKEPGLHRRTMTASVWWQHSNVRHLHRISCRDGSTQQ